MLINHYPSRQEFLNVGVSEVMEYVLNRRILFPGYEIGINNYLSDLLLENTSPQTTRISYVSTEFLSSNEYSKSICVYTLLILLLL